ncbi:VWA domain-containing protein [Trujillonella endophytica]|uniref:Stress response protein SCP2 n=1 Tax=Trujillonella endophytica TaxID=673521 RepID=A0A1H8PI57_9ACTN|nr:VWA domain-containing protein [Trujillella endophytica]SEO41610.1 Stress response protein SCP2 [Trujillella endophytica]
MSPAPTTLTPGGNVGLAQAGLSGEIVVTLTWQPLPGTDMDLSALLCGAGGTVRSDDDFVFYNQPVGGDGAVRHLGKSQRGSGTVDQLRIDPARVPADVDKVVIGASLDGPGTFGALSGLAVEVAAAADAPAAVRCDLTAGPETALVFAEVYRRNGEWKVRAIGQGYRNGLAGLATDYGVTVDEPSAAPAPAPAPAPTSAQGWAPPAGPPIDAPPPVAAPAAAGAPTAAGAPPISLEKKRLVDLEKKLEHQAPQMLSLVKTAGVSLQKRGLAEHTARVALVLDISGSMSGLFRSGAVQRLCERVLALGLRFDDDGVVDVFLFGKEVHQPEGLRLEGHQQYIADLTRRHKLEYDTRYGAAMSAVRRHYFGTSQERTEPLPAQVPVYVMFLTDGAPSDKAVATKQIRAASYEPVFWQFMGIGSPKQFSYLQRLDDLDNRYTDNADFFSVSESDLLGRSAISDDALFDRLMNEYPGWLQRARAQQLLVP